MTSSSSHKRPSLSRSRILKIRISAFLNSGFSSLLIESCKGAIGNKTDFYAQAMISISPMYPLAEHSIPISTCLNCMNKFGVKIDSRSPSAVVLLRSILFPHMITGTLSFILAIRGSQYSFSLLMISKLLTSYTKIITLAFSISLSVYCSAVLFAQESTSTVALLFGSR